MYFISILSCQLVSNCISSYITLKYNRQVYCSILSLDVLFCIVPKSLYTVSKFFKYINQHIRFIYYINHFKQILEIDFKFKIVRSNGNNKYSRYGILVIDYFKKNGSIGKPKKTEIITLEIEKVKSTPKYEVRLVNSENTIKSAKNKVV